MSDTPRSGGGHDPVEDVVADCLARDDFERAHAVDEACARHPDLAAEIRERVEALERVGLLDAARGEAQTSTPARLGDFKLLERLGGGGMGVVYLAQQISLARRVALKLIRPEMLYFADSRARFRREVDAVARLQHPGIVPVYSVGEEDGLPYFAMEYIEGVTLAAVLARVHGRHPESLDGRDLSDAITVRSRGARMTHAGVTPAKNDVDGTAGARTGVAPLFAGSWEQVCLRIVQQAAEALHHAHERGILHRDLKPSNIMITRAGRVMLVDFGLARTEGAERITRTGSQLGSLSYMSPEQLRGTDKGLDRRTDVYSLGITLHELLTLSLPYEAEDSQVTRARIIDGAPEGLRLRNGAISWEANTVTLTAMDRDPARRYATAADLARDIHNVLERRPIVARRASPLLRARRWTQRHPARAVSLALGTMLLVGVPSVFAWQKARELERSRGSSLAAASSASLAGDPGLALALAIEGARASPGPMADDALVAALNACYEEKVLFQRKGGIQWAEFGPDGRSVVVAPGDRPDTRDPARGDFGVRILDASSGACRHVLEGHTRGIRRARFSPAGELVVSASDDGTARIWDAHTGHHVRVLSGHGDRVRDACFDPSGTRVATASDDCDARVWDVASGAVSILRGHTEGVHAAEFSAEGTMLLTASYDGSARLWDARTGAHIRTFEPPRGAYKGVHAAHFSPDGSSVVVASNNRTPTIFDVATAYPWRVLHGHEREVYDVGWSPDGRRVVTASYDGTARVWDAQSGALACRLVGHRSIVSAATFSPDSTRVLTCSGDGTVRLWEAVSGREVASLSAHGLGLQSAVFDGSGTRVVTAGNDGSVRLWDASSGARFFDLSAHDGAVRDVMLSPDGRALATASADATACIFDARSGARVGTLRGHEQGVLWALFSPDGRTLMTGSNDRTARTWDVASGAAARVLAGHELWVSHGAFSADGALAATTAGGSVRVWDLANGAVVAQSLANYEDFHWLHFPGAGNRLFAIRNHDMLAGEPRAGGTLARTHVVDPRRFYRASVLVGDGRTLVTGHNDGSLCVWNPDVRAPLFTWKARPVPIVKLIASSDATRAVSLASDGTLDVWDTHEWRLVATVAGFDGFDDSDLACNGDATRIAIISGRAACVWSTNPARELARLQRDEADALCVALDARGRRVYAGFSDGRVWAWTIYDDPLKAALERAPRGLTPEERRRFGLGAGR